MDNLQLKQAVLITVNGYKLFISKVKISPAEKNLIMANLKQIALAATTEEWGYKTRELAVEYMGALIKVDGGKMPPRIANCLKNAVNSLRGKHHDSNPKRRPTGI